MLQNPRINIRLYYTMLACTGLLAVALLALSAAIGKNELFLWLNGNGGPAADFFFEYVTYLGDGALWAAWLVYIILYKKIRLLPLLASAALVLTLLTQFSKQVIFPNESRPLLAIADQSMVHYVFGVTVHSINSFPSGHTGTAFTFALLIALLTHRRRVAVAAIAAAVLVGYSRIYLGQHFPLDVGAGMLVACGSTITALVVHQAVSHRLWPAK